MRIDYTEEQAEFADQMREVHQGAIVYRQPGETTGPAFDPVIGPPVDHDLIGYASGVSQDYVDGTTIVATDKEVTAAVFAVTPDTSGRIVMDGRELEIVRVWQVPAAGVPVAWKFICKA